VYVNSGFAPGNPNAPARWQRLIAYREPLSSGRGLMLIVDNAGDLPGNHGSLGISAGESYNASDTVHFDMVSYWL
jgi:hypothetical protein